MDIDFMNLFNMRYWKGHVGEYKWPKLEMLSELVNKK